MILLVFVDGVPAGKRMRDGQTLDARTPPGGTGGYTEGKPGNIVSGTGLAEAERYINCLRWAAVHNDVGLLMRSIVAFVLLAFASLAWATAQIPDELIVQG